MNWNAWIRQTHRWLSIVFTVAFIAALVISQQPEIAVWAAVLALPPLALLLVTGLYLFGLPYATKWRNRRRTGG